MGRTSSTRDIDHTSAPVERRRAKGFDQPLGKHLCASGLGPSVAVQQPIVPLRVSHLIVQAPGQSASAPRHGLGAQPVIRGPATHLKPCGVARGVALRPVCAVP